MLTCETCGEIVPEGTQYCPNCGARLSGGGRLCRTHRIPLHRIRQMFRKISAHRTAPQIPRKALPHRHRKHRTLSA
ncbi:MAG: zinc-ribbon domain-containing protein [Ruminococcus callidus]